MRLKLQLVRWATILAAVYICCISSPLWAQEAQPAGGQAPPTAVPNISMIEMFRKGGFFMYPTALASVMALAIILERFVSLRRSQVIPAGFIEGLRTTFRTADDRDAALAYCRQRPSPISRMMEAGLKRLPRGIEAAEKAIEDAGGNEALKLRRNMRFLYALGSVATLLGLIGTISGMIKAFQVAAVAGVGRVDQLSTGIYEAMVNTFSGLAVAVVVTIFYYFFVGRIEKIVADLNDTLADFSEQFSFNAESAQELAAISTL